MMVRSIHAVGCSVDATAGGCSSSNEEEDNRDSAVLDMAPINEEPVRIERNVGDEIMIEEFRHPTFHWNALTDPVMGGRSDWSVSIDNDVASFTGHMNIVPFLQAPGFITMETRCGICPDVASSTSLE